MAKGSVITEVPVRMISSREDHDILFERTIQNMTEGLSQEYFKYLYSKVSKCNALTITNYITSVRIDVNLSDHYRGDLIKLLSKVSMFFNNQKSFNEITREDILSFLNSFRKLESVDPLHKWIGTYNIYRMHLMRFFKWLYYPKIDPIQRPKPPVIENISQLKRKEQSIYKPTG